MPLRIRIAQRAATVCRSAAGSTAIKGQRVIVLSVAHSESNLKLSSPLAGDPTTHDNHHTCCDKFELQQECIYLAVELTKLHRFPR